MEMKKGKSLILADFLPQLPARDAVVCGYYEIASLMVVINILLQKSIQYN